MNVVMNVVMNIGLDVVPDALPQCRKISVLKSRLEDG